MPHSSTQPWGSHLYPQQQDGGDPSSAVAQGWDYTALIPSMPCSHTRGGGRVEPHAWLALGMCCCCQHPSPAWGARLETPSPSASPHQHTSASASSSYRLQGKCPQGLKIAWQSPAKAPGPLLFLQHQGMGDFMRDLVSLGPSGQAGLSTLLNPCFQHREVAPAWISE